MRAWYFHFLQSILLCFIYIIMYFSREQINVNLILNENKRKWKKPSRFNLVNQIYYRNKNSWRCEFLTVLGLNEFSSTVWKMHSLVLSYSVPQLLHGLKYISEVQVRASSPSLVPKSLEMLDGKLCQTLSVPTQAAELLSWIVACVNLKLLMPGLYQ